MPSQATPAPAPAFTLTATPTRFGQLRPGDLFRRNSLDPTAPENAPQAAYRALWIRTAAPCGPALADQWIYRITIETREITL